MQIFSRFHYVWELVSSFLIWGFRRELTPACKRNLCFWRERVLLFFLFGGIRDKKRKDYEQFENVCVYYKLCNTMLKLSVTFGFVIIIAIHFTT